jgi:hypothetical protein
MARGTTDRGERRRMTAPKWFNLLVRPILRSPFHRLLSGRLVLLRVRGRKTGRLHVFPVGYVQEHDVLHVLVGDYRTKTWWRNFEGGARVELTLRGRRVEATGEVLRWESQPDALVAALARYVSESPFSRRALGITGSREPDRESVRAAALNVVMVEFRLWPSGGTPDALGTRSHRDGEVRCRPARGRALVAQSLVLSERSDDT